MGVDALARVAKCMSVTMSAEIGRFPDSLDTLDFTVHGRI